MHADLGAKLVTIIRFANAANCAVFERMQQPLQVVRHGQKHHGDIACPRVRLQFCQYRQANRTGKRGVQNDDIGLFRQCHRKRVMASTHLHHMAVLLEKLQRRR